MRFIRFPHNRKFILLSSRCNFGQQNSSPASHRFFSPWPASYSSASARLAQSYFCLSRCPCGTFQFFFSLKFLWQDVRGREREREMGRQERSAHLTDNTRVWRKSSLCSGCVTTSWVRWRCIKPRWTDSSPHASRAHLHAGIHHLRRQSNTACRWKTLFPTLYSSGEIQLCSYSPVAGSCAAAHICVFMQKHSTLF